MGGERVKRWLDGGRYLPRFMRDFHAQKDVFKSLDDYGPRLKLNQYDPNSAELDWVTAHVFTIDRFLHFMGRHGYTLQRSQAKVEFRDIHQTIRERRERESAAFGEMFKARRKELEGGES